MNIYNMYNANNKNFNFYVKRDGWGNTIAKIISIDKVIEGEEIPGTAPYYDNLKVIAEFYKVDDKKNCHKGNLHNIGELSCPGTFKYTLI